MIRDELIYQTCRQLRHEPTADQRRAIQVFASFLTDRNEHAVMILRGAAGTGKTTLAAAMVRTLQAMKQRLVLLAPTGRAAKVFSLYADTPAYTIHRRIYRQKSMEGGFNLNFNSSRDTLFIVDEASMISLSAEREGNGLLDDLIRFVYGGNNCRLILIGDRAQLPPVGETESPALIASVLNAYGLHVFEADLNEVLRQSHESGILWNANRIAANQLSTLPPSIPPSPVGEGSEVRPSEVRLPLPRLRLKGFPDITIVPGDELIETLASSYSHVGMDETIVITRTNKRANIYNQGIRNTVLDREDELSRGDRLMVVKNNYTLLPPSSAPSLPPSSEGMGADSPPSPIGEGSGVRLPSFLANGDMAVVQRVRHVHALHGFRFAEITLCFPDYDDYELTALTLLDTLASEAPALTREQQDLLYQSVMADYADLPLKADRLQHLKADRYYNALQVKYAYAVTCHKAQGGQWQHVYIDQGYMTDDMLTSDYFHWLYTALTRATDHVFLVNWPKTQVEEEHQ